MRIQGPNGASPVSTSKTVRRSGSGGFVLDQSEETAQGPTSSSGTRSIGGIDILMALQGIEDPIERRRRAVGRGRSALDVLDELKIALLSGSLDVTMISRLKAAVAGLKDGSGDPLLDGVLAEIELRVEVELAKMEPAPGV